MFRAAGPMGASRTLEAGHHVKATAPFLWAVTLLPERPRGGVTQWEPQTRSELLLPSGPEGTPQPAEVVTLGWGPPDPVCRAPLHRAGPEPGICVRTAGGDVRPETASLTVFPLLALAETREG